MDTTIGNFAMDERVEIWYTWVLEIPLKKNENHISENNIQM
jgi:hypothetical protein